MSAEPLRILFAGQSWLGSCARSLKQALAENPSVELDEIDEDTYLPNPDARWLRAINRFLLPAYRRELDAAVLARLASFRPHVFMTYKGTAFSAGLLQCIRSNYPTVATVNVYPDCSPLSHGNLHRRAVGAYDLIVSTKPFHAAQWHTTYGYDNPCTFVPQGYDPAFHLVDRAPESSALDLALVATWRPQYHRLMVDLARELADRNLKVGIAGYGWPQHAAEFPSHWQLPGPLLGRSYIRFARNARICLAPVTREIVVNGQTRPGDEDTTRSYELAAAYCFFIHRRTGYIRTVYDEATEVPMFDGAVELAAHVRHFLDHPLERAAFAQRAHARAVPAYSVPNRANEVLATVRAFLAEHHNGPGA